MNIPLGLSVRKLVRGSLLTYASIFVASGAVEAATKDWAPPVVGSGGSTLWANGTNWLGGVAPINDLTTDIARFNQMVYNFQPNADTTSVAGIEIGDGSTATGALTLSGTNLSIGASGITKFANSGAATISAPITLGADQTWTNNSSSTLLVSGIVGGTNALSIGGSGSVTLTGANTFSGGVTVRSGTLIAGGGATAAIEGATLGTGTVTLGDSSGSNSATLAFATTKNSPTFANAIVVAAGSTGTTTISSSGSNPILTGAITLNHDLTLSNSGASPLTLNGVITGSRDITVNTTGAGQVVFGGNNQGAWTGNLYITGGLFRISGQTGGVKSVSASNTIYIASGATFQNNNNILTIAGVNDLNGGGGVLDNTANNARDLTLGGSGNYNFSGVIQNSGGASSSLGLIIALTGSGSQTLSGANTYLGNTTINSGILNIQNSSALGGTTQGTTIAAGATLQLQGGISVGAEALTVNGLGASGQNGALVNVGGTNNYAGLLTIGTNVAGTAISSNSGTLNLTNTGTIANTGGRALILTGSGNGSLAGALVNGAITKNGSGAWTLSGAHTYVGATTVNAGTLVINGSLTSAITAVAGTVAGSGSTTGNVVIGDGAGGHDAYISPGNSAGTFTTTGSLSLSSDASYAFELNGTTAAADKLIANGVSINTSALFSFTLLGDTSALLVGQAFTIIDNTGAGNITGSFSNLTAGGIFDAGNGLTFAVSGASGSYGNDLILTVSSLPVIPEPTTVGLLAAGLSLLAWSRYRKTRRATAH